MTFVGSGEPTLHSRLGWMIRQVRQIATTPVAVITNGSLLHRPDVRRELTAADAVLPTLDAGSAGLHRRVNRPHGKLRYEEYVQGLIDFREEFKGNLWVEVMLVAGLNDHEEDLLDIARTMERVRPDEIHLNLPIRCPAESWVRPSDEEGIARAERILGEASVVVRPRAGAFDLGAGGSPVDAIVDIVTRHPMRHTELLRALTEQMPDRASEVLAELESGTRVRVVERSGVRFWCAAETRH